MCFCKDDPNTYHFDYFQRKQGKHAKCKYNIVYDVFARYFPRVSLLNTALQCLRQRSTYGSELRFQLRPQPRLSCCLLRGS